MFGGNFVDRLIDLVIATPTFLLAIILHEVAHGWAAERRGDPTARWAGRLTLDPKPHIDPLGALMFVFSWFAGMGFGWAKPVPVNPNNFRNPRRDMMLTSVAGPAANLGQLLVWWVILRGYVIVFPALPQFVGVLILKFLIFGVIINIVLLVFNLLPIPPLDGSRVLAWVLPEEQAQWLDRLEPFGFIILLIFIMTGFFRYTVVPAMDGLIRFFLPFL